MARREREERPIPAHPYRDSAIVYGVMALLLVVLAGVTGGSLVRAAAAGAVFFLVATAWGWWKFRKRIRERDARDAAAIAGSGRVPALSGEGSTDDAGQAPPDVAGNGSVRGRTEL